MNKINDIIWPKKKIILCFVIDSGYQFSNMKRKIILCYQNITRKYDKNCICNGVTLMNMNWFVNCKISPYTHMTFPQSHFSNKVVLCHVKVFGFRITSIANSLKCIVLVIIMYLNRIAWKCVYCYKRQNSLQVQYHFEIVNVNRSLHTHLKLNITTHYLIVTQKQRLVCHADRLF